MINVHGWLVLEWDHYIISTAVSSGLALVMLYRTFERLRRARWVEDTPTSKVRSAAQGLVELSGQIESGGQPELESPLSRVPCIWYRYRIERFQQMGRFHRWHVVEQGESQQAFLLRDETGDCWVLPGGAEVHPQQQKRWEGHQRRPWGGYTGGDFLVGLAGNRYRYSEEWLCEGDPLYALGWFETGNASARPGDAVRRLLSAWKADYKALLARFDTNGDERLDMAEWEAVRTAAIAQTEQEARLALRAAPINSLRKPSISGLPFVLSNHLETGLSKRLRRQSLCSLVSMTISGVIAAALWLALV